MDSSVEAPPLRGMVRADRTQVIHPGRLNREELAVYLQSRSCYPTDRLTSHPTRKTASTLKRSVQLVILIKKNLCWKMAKSGRKKPQVKKSVSVYWHQTVVKNEVFARKTFLREYGTHAPGGAVLSFFLYSQKRRYTLICISSPRIFTCWLFSYGLTNALYQRISLKVLQISQRAYT